MDNQCSQVASVLHWNYRGYTEFPLQKLQGEEADITDIYLKENLISRIPCDICKLSNLESLYLSGNDITELPREISKLRSLKCLDISGNRLRYIPEEIADASNLKFLILDENELKHLPLRIAELRALRYLSVCDNKLEWLPQRPVYNYHHCEFRFWRNAELKSIPYSLWNHMFRDQQIRSLNIGCLSIEQYPNRTKKSGKFINITDIKKSIDAIVKVPYNYEISLNSKNNSPASLFELSKRKVYELICDSVKKLNDNPTNVYPICRGFDKSIIKLRENFGDFNINNNIKETDINGNYKNSTERICVKGNLSTNRNKVYVPADIVEDHLPFLPHFIKSDLCNGPASRCENVTCKKPIFDFVYIEFCICKVILIDSKEDVMASAAFCSKQCADSWKSGRSVLQWRFV